MRSQEDAQGTLCATISQLQPEMSENSNAQKTALTSVSAERYIAVTILFGRLKHQRVGS